VFSFNAAFGFFLTWWGAFLMAALDATLLFFLPFGIDALIIYLAARDRDLFWIYPLLATAGSMVGAAVTYSIGRAVGDVGLKRIIPERRLARLQKRVSDSGAIALALPALLPPPFPLTPFILTCGALSVNRWRFFSTFASVRLLRFGTEALLARVYGRSVLNVLQAEWFQAVVIGFAVIAVVGSIVSAVVLWKNSHPRRPVTA
jgi:membrane protein YqaA with SNARE-associated domain